MTPFDVHLENSQVAAGILIGVMRMFSSLVKKEKNNANAEEEKNWDRHINGACGEAAACKLFDLYNPMSVNTYKSEPDAKYFDVRTADNHKHSLIIRPDDKDGHMVVLVTGRITDFKVHGWYWSHEAKQDKWWKAPNNRPGAWFVPRSELKPLYGIVEILHKERVAQWLE